MQHNALLAPVPDRKHVVRVTANAGQLLAIRREREAEVRPLGSLAQHSQHLPRRVLEDVDVRVIALLANHHQRLGGVQDERADTAAVDAEDVFARGWAHAKVHHHERVTRDREEHALLDVGHIREQRGVETKHVVQPCELSGAGGDLILRQNRNEVRAVVPFILETSGESHRRSLFGRRRLLDGCLLRHVAVGQLTLNSQGKPNGRI
mmetsp:Transcript_14017/g.32659  ORF Transcript_14017/g.32659 Transcript_14017/m.32659 type:complete len:207 (-) Transcript_14017:105-725(-)